MNCARDRLLLILAERAATVHGLAEPDRTPFVATCITAWQAAIHEAYAGEPVRFTVKGGNRDRTERDAKIIRLAREGTALRLIAERMRVSRRLVQLIVQRAAQSRA